MSHRRLNSFRTPGVRLSVLVCAVIVLLETFGGTQVSATPGKVFFTSGTVKYDYKIPEAGDTSVAEGTSVGGIQSASSIGVPVTVVLPNKTVTTSQPETKIVILNADSKEDLKGSNKTAVKKRKRQRTGKGDSSIAESTLRETRINPNSSEEDENEEEEDEEEDEINEEENLVEKMYAKTKKAMDKKREGQRLPLCRNLRWPFVTATNKDIPCVKERDRAVVERSRVFTLSGETKEDGNPRLLPRPKSPASGKAAPRPRYLLRPGAPPGFEENYLETPEEEYEPPPFPDTRNVYGNQESGPPPPGYDSRGPPPPGYDSRGPPSPGYDNRGPPPPGYDNRGPPPQGYDSRGPPPPGYDSRGPPPQGYDNRGPPPQNTVNPTQQAPGTLSNGFGPPLGTHQGPQTPFGPPPSVFTPNGPPTNEQGPFPQSPNNNGPPSNGFTSQVGSPSNIFGSQSFQAPPQDSGPHLNQRPPHNNNFFEPPNFQGPSGGDAGPKLNQRPPQVTNFFGPSPSPPSQDNNYGPPRQNNNYGPPPQTNYGPPGPPPSNSYGPPPTQRPFDNYGSPSATPPAALPTAPSSPAIQFISPTLTPSLFGLGTHGTPTFRPLLLGVSGRPTFLPFKPVTPKPTNQSQPLRVFGTGGQKVTETEKELNKTVHQLSKQLEIYQLIISRLVGRINLGLPGNFSDKPALAVIAAPFSNPSGGDRPQLLTRPISPVNGNYGPPPPDQQDESNGPQLLSRPVSPVAGNYGPPPQDQQDEPSHENSYESGPPPPGYNSGPPPSGYNSGPPPPGYNSGPPPPGYNSGPPSSYQDQRYAASNAYDRPYYYGQQQHHEDYYGGRYPQEHQRPYWDDRNRESRYYNSAPSSRPYYTGGYYRRARSTRSTDDPSHETLTSSASSNVETFVTYPERRQLPLGGSGNSKTFARSQYTVELPKRPARKVSVETSVSRVSQEMSISETEEIVPPGKWRLPRAQNLDTVDKVYENKENKTETEGSNPIAPGASSTATSSALAETSTTPSTPVSTEETLTTTTAAAIPTTATAGTTIPAAGTTIPATGTTIPAAGPTAESTSSPQSSDFADEDIQPSFPTSSSVPEISEFDLETQTQTPGRTQFNPPILPIADTSDFSAPRYKSDDEFPVYGVRPEEGRSRDSNPYYPSQQGYTGQYQPSPTPPGQSYQSYSNALNALNNNRLSYERQLNGNLDPTALPPANLGGYPPLQLTPGGESVYQSPPPPPPPQFNSQPPSANQGQQYPPPQGGPRGQSPGVTAAQGQDPYLQQRISEYFQSLSPEQLKNIESLLSPQEINDFRKGVYPASFNDYPVYGTPPPIGPGGESRSGESTDPPTAETTTFPPPAPTEQPEQPQSGTESSPPESEFDVAAPTESPSSTTTKTTTVAPSPEETTTAPPPPPEETTTAPPPPPEETTTAEPTTEKPAGETEPPPQPPAPETTQPPQTTESPTTTTTTTEATTTTTTTTEESTTTTESQPTTSSPPDEPLAGAGEGPPPEQPEPDQQPHPHPPGHDCGHDHEGDHSQEPVMMGGWSSDESEDQEHQAYQYYGPSSYNYYGDYSGQYGDHSEGTGSIEDPEPEPEHGGFSQEYEGGEGSYEGRPHGPPQGGHPQGPPPHPPPPPPSDLKVSAPPTTPAPPKAPSNTTKVPQQGAPSQATTNEGSQSAPNYGPPSNVQQLRQPQQSYYGGGGQYGGQPSNLGYPQQQQQGSYYSQQGGRPSTSSFYDYGEHQGQDNHNQPPPHEYGRQPQEYNQWGPPPPSYGGHGSQQYGGGDRGYGPPSQRYPSGNPFYPPQQGQQVNQLPQSQQSDQQDFSDPPPDDSGAQQSQSDVASAGGLLSNAQITALLIVPLGQNDTSLQSLDLSSLLGLQTQLQQKLQPLLANTKGLENDDAVASALAAALVKQQQ